ncbi:hypothetical protein BU17DRAFT_38351 [Hysterangium stoloniferum]|nr:hypothetical protein BU17DRAFT_38351 [Hysterangium stoloniferum]
MSSSTPRVVPTYHKPPVAYGAGYGPPSVPRQPIPDDYEKWYTEYSPTNRMLLSLKSGIPKEVNWALERMCRLSNNEQFVLKNIPGLADALVEWPEWYVAKGANELQNSNIFSTPPLSSWRRRHALEATFLLRNASLNEPNAQYLATHRRTLLLLHKALHQLKADTDANTEFLLHIVDLAHSVISNYQETTEDFVSISSLIAPLEKLAESSNDRILIITALRTLTLVLSFLQNPIYVSSASPALLASIRYLPLLGDSPLITACLDYLYVHLSHPPMVKAFLLHPDMPSTLKLLVTLILREQQEETISVDLISEPVRTAPALMITRRQCELTNDELDRIAKVGEPERSYEWMRSLFVASDAEEMTQVEFWNLYKDTFGQRAESHPLLSAAEVIKNVSHVFPTAQAMVLPGQPSRFVIRGITHKMMDVTEERFKCRWDHSNCPTPNYQTPNELWTHVLEHLQSVETTDLVCKWSHCQFSAPSEMALKKHASTHIPTPQPVPRHPSQVENITLPIAPFPHPSSNPTKRPPPPPPHAQLTYTSPSADPPSTSLTALLIIRVLFRASFAATDAAPRADEDHFGFPGIVEEDSDDEMRDEEEEACGKRRGRKAFTGVRVLLEEVKVRDNALMAWIGEMVDVSMDEKPVNV